MRHGVIKNKKLALGLKSISCVASYSCCRKDQIKCCLLLLIKFNANLMLFEQYKLK